MKLFSVTQAKEEINRQGLKIARQNVATYCKDGKIKAQKIGNQYVITDTDLQDYIDERKEKDKITETLKSHGCQFKNGTGWIRNNKKIGNNAKEAYNHLNPK
jgi:hypothetical protein